MKTFEQIFNSICDNEIETYDVEKMKILYNILNIVLGGNKIISLKQYIIYKQKLVLKYTYCNNYVCLKY